MSSITENTANTMKNLEEFLGDLTILGSLQGFRYFQPWLRGREELLLSVANEDIMLPHPLSSSSNFVYLRFYSILNRYMDRTGLATCRFSQQPGHLSQRLGPALQYSLNTLSPPELPLSWRSRSACGQSDGGLPPASPCDRELSNPGPGCTLFLVGCYARYGQPYAWVRSAHRSLPWAREGDGDTRDTPLKLDSTAHWHSNAVPLWDVVAELVGLCTWPPPHNPFSVDLPHLHSLPPTLRFLASGATAGFLQRLLVHGDRGRPYCTAVAMELEAVNRLHINALPGDTEGRGRERGGERRRGAEARMAAVRLTATEEGGGGQGGGSGGEGSENGGESESGEGGKRGSKR